MQEIAQLGMVAVIAGTATECADHNGSAHDDGDGDTNHDSEAARSHLRRDRH